MSGDLFYQACVKEKNAVCLPVCGFVGHDKG